MNLKKLVSIGALALVVIGCVLVAGCTNNATPATTTEDFAVGTWSTADGKTTVVLTNDFKGILTIDDEKTSLTWKKTVDGKYTLIRDKDGSLENVTIDKIKGTLTNDAGTVLSKKLSGMSGTAMLGEAPNGPTNPLVSDERGVMKVGDLADLPSYERRV